MIKIDEFLKKQIEEARLVPLEFLFKDITPHEQLMQSIREDPILSLKRSNRGYAAMIAEDIRELEAMPVSE
jgi:hypothetical protein